MNPLSASRDHYLSSIPLDIQTQALDRAKSVLQKTEFLGQPLLDNRPLAQHHQPNFRQTYTAYHPRFDYGVKLTNTRQNLNLILRSDPTLNTAQTVPAYTKSRYSADSPAPAQYRPYTQAAPQYRALSRSTAEIPTPDTNGNTSPISRSGLFLTPPSTPLAITTAHDQYFDKKEPDSPMVSSCHEASRVRIIRSAAKRVPVPVRCESHHSSAVSVVDAEE